MKELKAIKDVIKIKQQNKRNILTNKNSSNNADSNWKMKMNKK